MSSRLHSNFTSVTNVEDREELRREVVRFTRSLGFETVTLMAVADHVGGESKFAWVDNTPEPYRAVAEDLANCRRDPVMQHCKRSPLPRPWNQATYTSVGLGAKWEEQAHYGYCAGIALAIHLPHGLHMLIGVDRDQSLPEDLSEVSRMAADLHLFAIHAQETALRILLPDDRNESEPRRLTGREMEALRWTMEGKTAWEVGRILGISEQTAVRHVNNATHKLGCVNKHHAVVKALRIGLIR